MIDVLVEYQGEVDSGVVLQFLLNLLEEGLVNTPNESLISLMIDLVLGPIS